ncbi:MAG TPA: hypothetical protein VFO77_01935 [Actinoplanes sp.]|nr:hypothetical protein [Actinoplanes sp.]
MHQAADTFALASRRVVRFGAVYSVVVALAGGLGLAGYTAVRSGAADPRDLSTQASFLIVGTIIGLVGLVCVIGLLISTVVWMVSAHRLTAAGPGLAGYGGVALCFVLIALAYVLPSRMPTVSGAVATDMALRIGGVILLIAGVLRVRARVRRETGDTALGGRPPLITSGDWDASTWDPEVLRDTDRRRGATP